MISRVQKQPAPAKKAAAAAVPQPAFSIETGPAAAKARLILAHGAGAGITSPFMEAIAESLTERAIALTRFEFAYMAARRDGGSRRPPPKAETLVSEYRAVVAAVHAKHPRQSLVIGGKSLGGRVASLAAADLYAEGAIKGLVCLGYPFHPPGRPDELRTEHLKKLRCPALIVQGERDPFGNRAEVEALKLSKDIAWTWVGDGDHDFGPRGASGFTRKGNIAAAADAVAAFIARICPAR